MEGKLLEDKKKYQDHAETEIVKDSQKDREKDLQDQNKKQNAKGTQEKSAASKSGSEAKAGKKIRWITINEKYMSVCRYVLFVLFIAIVVYMLVSHWSATTAFISNLLKVLSPFILGLLIAYFLLPIVVRTDGLLQKITKGRKPKLTKVLAMLISYILVLGFIAVTFVFVIPQMGQSIQELTNKVPGMYQTVTAELVHLQERYPDLDTELIEEQLQNIVPNLIKLGTNLVSNAIPMLYSVSVSIVKWLINLLLGIVISIYMI